MKKYNSFLTIVLAILVAGSLFADSPLVVASLNPLASDLARQVGGERVRVIELMKTGRDPHVFRPSPSEMRAASNARLFLAMGKGLETFLDDLADGLRADQEIFEIGRMVPSLRMNRTQAMFACCAAHAKADAIDPHWWHSVPRMRKGGQLLADEFARIDPAGSDHYRECAAQYDRELSELHQWTHRQFSRIPRKRRILATAHAAFNYLCDEYGFQSLPVGGLTSLDEPKPSELARIIDTVREQNIKTVFPEATTSSIVLEAMVQETGVQIGDVLLPGTLPPEDPTYTAMVRHNVNAIVMALAPEEND
jgi:zinc/manganese transport system substrate-binding protein